MAPDEWWVNMSRVNGIDATDPAQYTQGEIICAEQNEEIVRYLKAYIPGFENAYVDRVAPFMGIRETRRIVGGIHSDRGRHLQLRQVRRRHRRRKLSGGPSPSGGRRLLALLVSGLLRHPVPLSDTAENRRSHRRRTQRVDDASRTGFRPRHGSCNGSPARLRARLRHSPSRRMSNCATSTSENCKSRSKRRAYISESSVCSAGF